MRPTRRDEVVAGVWAFAEATLFFVVPDVWLTWVATADGVSVRRLLRCVGVAVTFAVVGGLCLKTYAWQSHGKAESLILRVPSVSFEQREAVREEARSRGMTAIALGWLDGRPYKLYAVEFGVRGAPPWQFAAWSATARGLRFLLTAFVAIGLAKLIRMQEAARVLWAVVWICVYTVYWWKHPLW